MNEHHMNQDYKVQCELATNNMMCRYTYITSCSNQVMVQTIEYYKAFNGYNKNQAEERVKDTSMNHPLHMVQQPRQSKTRRTSPDAMQKSAQEQV